MTLMCEESIFPLIPIKKEVKAVVSGIYITSVKGIRAAFKLRKRKRDFLQDLKKTKIISKRNGIGYPMPFLFLCLFIQSYQHFSAES